jgi:DNA-binding response OmpR family regulator
LWNDEDPHRRDDKTIRGYLRISLNASGYLTKAAASLMEAREELELEDYDVIVVDARLPDGQGVDLAAEVNAGGKKAVIISGHRPSMRRMEEAGITYLQKPFELPELLSAIQGRYSRR